MIHFTRYTKRKLIVYGIALLVVYAIFSSGYNKHRSETTIVNAKPEKVWEFVADFSKMKLLNPTMWVFNFIIFHSINSHLASWNKMQAFSLIAMRLGVHYYLKQYEVILC